ncbi:MAG: ABC transporter permease subunit [Leptolyngbyaceae cyanobacterium SM1_1_3]|nr:ABC transporter permease subunit [Leptolyngbyaceae cyanobacterium SM1_1_3]NJM85780.1 ABC transporter permease subunit [Leptolyngbyaceae cyanobacterium RM2_2_21]NJN02697.1 ABC transporter permease subunit [Leptolyngbyaceae cyanobacterium RM1_1_2]NJO11967.1 ABC transporter permease subunit [Leptolyngbyaceae cyanobacterium SL_1_1]
MTSERSSSSNGFNPAALLRDERFWKIAFQVIVVAVVVGILSFLVGNLSGNLARQGISFGFSFLSNSAGFSIGESVVTYNPQDAYAKALFIGLLNTLVLVVAGIVLATLVGTAAGVASFSTNWLVYKISRAYVGLVRNIPLLLQLFFWYFAIYGGLPNPSNQIGISGLVYLNNRGVSILWPESTLRLWIGLAALLIGAIAAVLVWRRRTHVMVEQGEPGKTQLYILWAILAAMLLVFIGLGWEFPEAVDGGGSTGGRRLSREYVASLSALVFYTGAFIAEIVRAGIQSVSKGQWEAARSVGFTNNLVMRLVVFPQSMRVIIPPLNSEFMNLAKNSSLAFAVAYPEMYAVANTTYNQTGRPIEVFIILMATYLVINLIISLGMNQLNQAVQFKER